MENTLEVAPEAPQAPMGAAQEPAGGQPPQMGGQPPVAPDGNLEQTQGAEAPPEPEFQFELPSGSKYRTIDDMIRGATEKDFAIERFKAELAELRAQQGQAPQAQATPQDTQAQFDAEFNSIASNIEQRLQSNPRWAGVDREAIREQAEIQAYSVMESREIARKEYQQIAQRQQHEQFVATTPDLNTPLAQEVYDRARASGRIFNNPQEHLDAVHAEMFRRGMHPSQPQVGGMQAAQSAMQQPRPVFGGLNGTGAAPVEQLPRHVSEALEYAQKRGVNDPAELARIKATAMAMNNRLVNR